MDFSIINIGSGNIGSIQNMIKYIGCTSNVICNAADVKKSNRLILPGVGSWNTGSFEINNNPLFNDINEAVLLKKKPVLGICLGMQLMLNKSEEGMGQGLNWISGSVKKFSFPDDTKNLIKVPHMGWNTVHLSKNEKFKLETTDQPRFYFVHSYYADCTKSENILATTKYGCKFASGISNHENIYGFQFHPEKSHKFGMSVFKAFVKI